MEEPSTNAQSPAANEESEGLVCPQCGYDLRSIASENCPECGLPIDRAAMSVSRIPWEHQDEIGRFRACWRTTGLVMFHPRRFAEEMNRPVSYARARRFQFIAVLLAWIAPTSWIVGSLVSELNPVFHGPGRLGWYLEALVIASGLFALWVFLFLASGVISYWFHPSTLPVHRQNRAIALSYYACAPLAWLWLPAAMLVLPALVDTRVSLVQAAMVVLVVLAISIAGALIFEWFMLSFSLMGAVTHSSAARKWAYFFSLPVLWLTCLALAFTLPAAVLLVSLVILNSR